MSCYPPHLWAGYRRRSVENWIDLRAATGGALSPRAARDTLPRTARRCPAPRRFDRQGGGAVAPGAAMSQFHTAAESNILINSSRNEIKADTTVRGGLTYEY